MRSAGGITPYYRAARRRLAPVRQALNERRNPALRRDRMDNELTSLILAIALREDSCCIDVGAHSGTILREMVRLAPRGRHVAYEPIPALAEGLRARFPGVDVREAAVANCGGRTSFNHVVTVPAMSGLRLRQFDGPVQSEVLDVRVESLDEALPDFVPTFIKIDVEGGELGVLQGAKRMLGTHRPFVLFEHGKGGADVYGTTSGEVHAVLAEAGLRIFDLGGGGPYSAAQLAEEFDRNDRWNWLAHQ
jgi:FkbM family methyltransferase